MACKSLPSQFNRTSLYFPEPILSTPLYQLAQHALRSPTNKTKFKLIFSNVAEKDILLREDLDTLAKRYPKTFEVVYVLDKPQEDWTGAFFSFFLSDAK